MVNVFTAATGNGFMRDIAGWIAEAAALTGRPSAVVDDRLPQVDGSINLVLAPHEFYELAEGTKEELQIAAAASIGVCTEQPGTPWFHMSVDACRRSLLTLDINPHGVDALTELGIEAWRLPLGGVPSMRSNRGVERNLDLLFMAGLDDRRGAILADLAPRLFRRRSDMRLFKFEQPVTASTPGVVFGQDKYDLLASSRLLLNLHRDRSMHLPVGATPPPYFEWARMLETMANGCVVVTERSEGHEPLVAGTHFVEAGIDDLGATIERLLGDPDELALISAAATDLVFGELALDRAIAPLLDRIEAEVLPRIPGHVRTSRPTAGLWRLGASRVTPPLRLGVFRPYRPIQVTAKRLALAENTALRRLDAAACVLAHGEPQHVVRVETPAWEQAEPEVSVVVSLYNYASVVVETLDSILASEGVAFEVVIVEDHATDDSRAVVLDYLDAHPDVAMVLLGKDANEGLAAARNLGFRTARADLVMVMDADNTIYPTCLRRLADVLTSDDSVDAAYAILEDFGDQRNIRSAIAWDVDRLCRANYIDAQAMWRRSTVLSLGGYRDDDEHVFGWEDWDLWLRLARDGRRAELHAEILGRYRVQQGSMIALTNLATDDAITAVRARYPELPWPTG